MKKIFGDPIDIYTRRQAIEDGVLVDLMQTETAKTVKEAGFIYPLAMTATAFSAVICPIDGELPPGQDLQGRLWDVLTMLKHAIHTHNARFRDRLAFCVNVSGKFVALISVCGPGDNGEPVITIMLPDED